MSGWVKLSDTWVESDGIEDLGAEAAMLHLSALSLSSRQSTDGKLPRRAVRRLWPCDDVDAAVKALEESGLWEPTEAGWDLATWNDHLLSAAEVDKRRKANAESSERYRRHKIGDHSMCERCAAVKAGDASRDTSPDLPLSSTTRLDSERSERGEERRSPSSGAASAGAPASPSAEDGLDEVGRLLATHPHPPVPLQGGGDGCWSCGRSLTGNRLHDGFAPQTVAQHEADLAMLRDIWAAAQPEDFVADPDGDSANVVIALGEALQARPHGYSRDPYQDPSFIGLCATCLEAKSHPLHARQAEDPRTQDESGAEFNTMADVLLALGPRSES